MEILKFSVSGLSSGQSNEFLIVLSREAWREGEQAIAFQLPGSNVKLLIENDEHNLEAVGIYPVESLDMFFSVEESLSFVTVYISPGRFMIYKDD